MSRRSPGSSSSTSRASQPRADALAVAQAAALPPAASPRRRHQLAHPRAQAREREASQQRLALHDAAGIGEVDLRAADHFVERGQRAVAVDADRQRQAARANQSAQLAAVALDRDRREAHARERGHERLHLAEDGRAGARVDEQRQHHRPLFVELADVQDPRSALRARRHPPVRALIGAGGDVRVALQAAQRERHRERREHLAGRDAGRAIGFGEQRC